MFRKQDDSTITVDELNLDYFQLLELDSTVQLRSLPNGVKDELNLLTGEYIQRVGEIVLDGSDLYNIEANTLSETHARFVIHCLDYEIGYQKPMLCDVFPTDGDTHTKRTIFTYYDGFVVCIEREKLVSVSTDGFKQYLQQNPITVQYELAEPIISYPRIVSNTQEREVGVKLPNGVCDTYNPSTGITVKRVGFIEFDGSEDWYEPFVIADRGAVDMYGIWTEQPLCDAKPASETEERIPGVCDRLKFKNSMLDFANEEFYFISPTGRFNMNLSRSKLSEPTEQALKTYLSQNPIKLWYELKNPIVTTDIVLPNGVHDEYNPLTGVYTKRVGYVELDGSDDENLDSIIYNHNKENTIVFFARQHTPLAKKYEDKGKGYPIYTNQFEYVDIDLGQTMSDGVSMDVEGAYMAFDGNVCFAISKEKLEPFGFTNDMNTIGQVTPIISKYLSQNPLKAWYELETPITCQLTPYFGLPMPYAYKDGHLIMDSVHDGQTLPPEITYQLTVNRTGQITQNNIKLKEHTARLSNLEYMLIEATLDSIFDREMQNFELELMNIKLINLDE